MTEEQFEALKRWIHRAAIAEVGSRLYNHQHSIDDVRRKATHAEAEARALLVEPKSGLRPQENAQ